MKTIKLSLSVVMLFLLSGCWDIKDLQTINYVTSVGLDYQNKQVVIYAQMLDFSSVAKQESGKANQAPVQWVGKGTGATINLAINNLYDTMQEKTLWSHITSIVVTGSFLEHEPTKMTDTFFRFRDIRYTPWIYGTHDSLEKIFSSHGFFNLSTLSTILNEPIENYEQKSYIVPMKYIDFISQAREPDKTILLPSITLDHTHWKKDEKPDSKLKMNGVFAIQNQSLKGWFNWNSLIGLRWMEPQTIRTPLSIKEGNSIKSVISMGKPTIDIKVINRSTPPVYEIKIAVNGNLVENVDSLTDEEMVEEAKKQIEHEIRSTYEAGLKKGVDLYSLEHMLFKKHYFSWKKLNAHEQLLLTPDSLQQINVQAKLIHSGMLRTHPIDVSPHQD